ncbi:unnamed protein product, partial [Meganyctiphanes norvegica]
RSWDSLVNKLHSQNIKSKKRVNILMVQHPLERLISVYNDLFLGGEPLYKYDTAWRNKTNSSQSWDTRWREYWLPALYSTKRIHLKGLDDSLTPKKAVNFLKISYGLYDMANSTASNESFTFEDFVEHVIKSQELGYQQDQWIPSSLSCKVCNTEYDYVLLLENSSVELPYLLQKMGFDID